MTNTFTKEDLPFLVEVMDKKRESYRFMSFAAEVEGGPTGTIKGDMSIPDPITVNAKGTMNDSDYKACAMVMTVCQNMVQKTLIDAAKTAGIPAANALKNMNAWVQAYIDFPFPFFNFKDVQSDTYQKSDFSIKANPEVVEQIVNIKNIPDLKDAVIGALKNAGGNLASYEGQERHFNYFGIITGYDELDISTRVIKFQMNLKTTNVKSLCVDYTSTNLDTSYDTYQFIADKDLMIRMQAKMGDKLIDYMADKLLQFTKDFYDQQLAKYKDNIVNILKG